MKKITFLLATLLCASAVFAQSDESAVVSTKKHKIVIQLTSNDTVVQKSVIKQLNNILRAAPNTKIEVVCHNNGLTFLQTATTKQADNIRALSARGVDFVACENTMRDRKVKREDLLGVCRIVPAGVVEIMLKQEKKWAYLKAG